MPFRSEGEQLRERIRRIEEQEREMLEEQARLEKQIQAHAERAGPAWGGVLLLAVAALASTCFVAFKAGEVKAEQRAALRLEELNRELGRRRDDLHDQVRLCSQEKVRASEEHTDCDHELTRVRLQLLLLSQPPVRRGGLR